jgi:hypothetical protein
MVKWLRSRAAKETEPAGKHCTGCRSNIPGASDDELRASGGVFLAEAGWFCGPLCERQYRLRFRIRPAATPADGSRAAAPTPTPIPTPVVAEATEEPERRPAAEELAEALRNRRRRMSGV